MNGKISSFRAVVLVLAAAMSAGCITMPPLTKAVIDKDSAKIEQLLASPKALDLEKTDSKYMTVLQYAIRNKDKALVDKLLAKGAKPQSGLGEAIKQADEALIRKLVKKGAAPDLSSGVKNGNVKIMTLLLDLLTATEFKPVLLGKMSAMLNLAAYENQHAIALFLISRGADVDMAVSTLRETAEHEEKWAAKSKYKNNRRRWTANAARARAGIAWLRTKATNKSAKSLMIHAEDPGVEKTFKVEAARYRSLAVKPALPESARKFKVQAEGAVRKKRFERAIERYGQALAIAPWWPEGHFNRALILGELERYGEAIREMKRYLNLVPNAADARKAQDKIYEWEDN